VEEGSYASQSALVADAIETLIKLQEEREIALMAMADEIRRRLQTPRDEFIPWNSENNPVARALDDLKKTRR